MKVLASQLLLLFAVVMFLNSTVRPSIHASPESNSHMDPAIYQIQEKASKKGQQEKEEPKKSLKKPSIFGKARQGTTMHEKHATFQIVGERIHVNLPKNRRVMIALENLTLERIHKYIGRIEGKKTWEVEGIVTEYEGQNFILISRAIVNSLETD